MAQESTTGRTPGELSATAAARALHRAVTGDHTQRQALAGAMHDAASRIEERHAFLAKLGVVAASAPDGATLATNIASIVVPGQADWCIIEVLEADGARRCVASTHAEAHLNTAAAARIGRIDGGPDESPLAQVLRTGKPMIGVVGPDSEWLDGTRQQDRGLLQQFGIHSFIVHPLLSRGRPVGVLAFMSSNAQRYGADELNATGDVARRVAAALDNFLLADTLEAARRAEERAQQSEHFLRTILSSVGEGVIVYDRELRHQMWNAFMEQLTGRREQEVLGKRALDVFPHLREYGVDMLLQRALAGETVQAPDTPYRVAHTGRSGWTSTSYSPHLAPTGEIIGVVGIVHDVSERKRAEEQLMHNALHDVLTGLPNRALFLDRLDRLLRHGTRDASFGFGVAFLDVDRFKVVNDSLGHAAGDEMLITIARRLESCLRLGDTVARFGGDEFAILLSGVHDVEDTTRVADRILHEFVEPFTIGGQEVFASASMGVSLSAMGYTDGDAMLRDADTAMYRAKGVGRGRYEIFDGAMHTQAVLQLELETDLRRAMERDELLVHYQPIVDLADGRLAGFEALVRWQHPTRGLMQPPDFIPLAEETGAIVPIGWWVLREACRQMRAWDDLYPDSELTVSVNLSGRQFAQPDLSEQIDRILTETGFNPRRLKLEITESAVVQNSTAAAITLGELRGRGVQLCLDDFGTGYSSLGYLHSFPLDTIKIDRTFVAALGNDAPTTELLQTILELGRNLGMDAVAEGVENAEQLEMLRALGPRHVQGYFFASPLQPDEAEALIREGRSWD
ncbi:MAG: putative bifunctional diguanylate cyclase/phosphodiesterase [Longimicrobiales bacterium]